ncbi:Transcriptional regulator of ribosomal biogenesis proteins [Ascosphaera aggregata]|nr:Transcriptional regulator of ribosomal biogenesis proteins [Ascosphaera aggregata]
MQNPTPPIDISSSRSRHSPVSPGQSNLTSALQRASTEGYNGQGTHYMPGDGRSPFGHFNPMLNNGNGGAMSFGLKNAGTGRKDSFSALAGMQWGAGSKPMSVVGGNSANMRKESLAGSLMAGSVMGGMSWGGISVGSWIKEDIAMSGTSPSFHSSSYLPKLEANFMRDFSCCSFTLPTLHDLLQHYEEAHAQKPPPTPHVQNQQRADSHLPSRAGSQTPRSIPGAPMARGMPVSSGLLSPRPRDMHPSPLGNNMNRSGPSGLGGGSGTGDVDEDMDMEMDDPLNDAPPPPAAPSANISRFGQPQQQQQHHGQQQQSNLGLTSLNLSMLHGQGNTIHHSNLQHLRSQAGTPGAGQTPTRNNPTVSSVNTPMLVSQNSSQLRGTPDSSTPGTPGGDAEQSMLGTPDISSPLPGGANVNHAFGGFNMQNTGAIGHGLPHMNSETVDLCIDEPAKRLFSPAQFNSPAPQLSDMQMNQNMSSAPGTPSMGGAPDQTNANRSTNILFRLGTSQYGPNSEIARRIREQQLLAGVPDTTLGLFNEEPKPFRCPVIGCEKAYKNQNGLKYHKAHGHNNQQLHDNADGTFSIVNPETCTPYPGTLGMEKEKPFRCEVCGKRYKNLNGLKYHRSHSPPCNPDLQQLVAATAAAGGVGVGGGAGLSLAGGVMRGQNINVAGAGLPGIGEEVL